MIGEGIIIKKIKFENIPKFNIKKLENYFNKKFQI